MVPHWSRAVITIRVPASRGTEPRVDATVTSTAAAASRRQASSVVIQSSMPD